MKQIGLSARSVLMHYRAITVLVLMMLTTYAAWAIPPAITAHPENKSICIGTNVIFAVTATNTTSYQWQEDDGNGWANIINGGIYSGATTAVLKLTGVTSGMSGYQYRCIATGPDNPPATSNAATLTLNTTTAISVQPTTTQTICSGGNASISTTAVGTSLTYQWYRYNGVTYDALVNDAVYSGVTTPSLTITGITNAGATAQSNGYYCSVSGTCGNANTNHSYLIVNALPAITANPVDDTVCNGSPVLFSVTATGTGKTYQWQISYSNGVSWSNLFNNATFDRVTESEMEVTVTDMSMHNALFRCVVSGACAPSAASAGARLRLDPIATFVTQADDDTVCPGANGYFSVTATGIDLTYQWQVHNGISWSNVSNGGIYSGATNNTLLLNGVSPAHNGLIYRCLLNSKCPGTAVSEEAVLYVPSTTALTMQPISTQTICSGGSASVTTAAVGTGITYQWYRYNGSTYDPIVNGGVYSGATTPTLTITGITNNGPAAISEDYYCSVSGLCGNASTIHSYLIINALPMVTVNPVNDTVCEGHPVLFSIDATGTGITYQWQASYSNGATWVNLTNNATFDRVTESEMEVSATDLSHHNALFRCVVTGACAPADTSATAKLTIDPLGKFVTHAANDTVCPGANGYFSVTATGIDLTYQWQVHNGISWSNVTNGGIYSGATSNKLVLTGVSPAHNGLTYRCLLNSKCPGTAISNDALLVVPVTTAVTMQPVNTQTICSGGNASITTSAVGTNVTYQWYRYNGSTYDAIMNGGVYSGANTPTLTITGIANGGPAAISEDYYCSVNGLCGNASTTHSYLTVNALPAVTVNPVNDTVCEGGNASFKVTATGTGTTYQWQMHDGLSWTNLMANATYSGVNTSELQIAAAGTSIHNTQYRCVVSGVCTPSATSGAATLVVNTSPVITMQPANTTICAGATGSISVAATGTDLTYQWQVNSGMGWSNITDGGIYSGATTASLTLTGPSVMHHNFAYRVVITGKCMPVVTSTSALLNIHISPAITMHPANTNVCPGANTTINVMATGSVLSYQWEANSGLGWNALTDAGIYSGTSTANLGITGASGAIDGTMYRCIVTGACTPPDTSDPALLTLNTVPAVNAHPANSTICLNGNTSFSVSASGTGITYQWQASGDGVIWAPVANTGFYSGANTATLSITGATTILSGNQYRCVVSGTCTPPVTSNNATLTVNIPTAINSQPSGVVVCPSANVSFQVAATGSGVTYQWQENTGSSWMDIINGGMYSGATTNKLTLANVQTMHNGYQYRCVVSGLCAPSPVASSAVTLTVNTVTAITLHPDSSQTICSGGNASFTTAAVGTSLTYQWYRYNGVAYVPVVNGGVYSGATSATLTVTGIANPGAAAQSHSFYCAVSGACGSVSTKHAQLIVNALPLITMEPVPDTTCAMSAASFKVTATGTGKMYQWQVSYNGGGSWNDLVNDTVVFKRVTESEMEISSAADSLDSTMYRCIVSGACAPADTSMAVMLKVNPLLTPSVTIQENNNNVCAGTLVSFTATPVNGGTAPSYQWQVNGVNAGFNSSVFTTAALSHQDVVRCVLTSNAVCPQPQTAVSNAIGMTIVSYQLPVATITSSSGSAACSGVPVTFTVATSFGGNAPSYQWQVNGVDVGMDTTVYVTDSLQNGDVVRCVLTSSFMCPSQQVVSSNNILMAITQTTPAIITISTVTDTTVCRNATVKLSAYYTNSGLTPQFQWIKNGNNIPGETQNTFTFPSSILHSGDVIQCRFTSSVQCVFPVLSDSLTFTVNNPVAPEVKVNVMYNGGDSYTFTATPTNGGTNPTYEWFVNSSKVSGTVGNTYTTSLLKKTDNVYVIMTSNHPCVTTAKTTSRLITTGVGEQITVLSDLRLYPNPNTGKFTVTGNYEMNGEATANITITNTLGQVIHKSVANVSGGKLNHTVNLETTPAAGMYIMRLEIDGKQDVLRFHIVE